MEHVQPVGFLADLGLAAIGALDAARDAGLVVTANTQISSLSQGLLRETCAELRAHGIQSWPLRNR